MRPYLFVLAALLAAQVSHAELTRDVRRTPDSVPEDIVVDAPEPRYVAPTLRDRIGRIWAPVYIDGHGPFRFVLDTGANTTAITPSVAMRIGAPIVASTMRVLGVTGTSVVPSVVVDSIEVGDLLLDRRQLPILNDVFGGADGVLGGDGLRDKRIFIDFRRDEITIEYSKHRTRRYGFVRVPVQVKAGHLLMFDVKVAGVRAKALLDTGAQSSIGNTSLRDALARKIRHRSLNNIIGVSLDVQSGETFAAPPITISGVTVSGMHVTFADVHIFDKWEMNDKPALLIGMDLIGLFDKLVIDYKHEELHVLP